MMMINFVHKGYLRHASSITPGYLKISGRAATPLGGATKERGSSDKNFCLPGIGIPPNSLISLIVYYIHALHNAINAYVKHINVPEHNKAAI